MKRLKMIMALLCCIILTVTMSACGKDTKNSSEKQNNDTVSTQKPVTKSITGIKGYPQTPISTSDMASKWSVNSYYDEFEFDADGSCTAFNRYCSLGSADNSEAVKEQLKKDGVTATWSAENTSFTMTLDDMKGKDTAFAKAYFENTLTPYIIQYIDSENDVSTEIFGEEKASDSELAAEKTLFGMNRQDIKGEWNIVFINKTDAVWEMESASGMTYDDANACVESVTKLAESDNFICATEENNQASLTYVMNEVNYAVTATLTENSTIVFRMEKK